MLEIRPRDTWRLLAILAISVVVVFLIMRLGHPPIEADAPAADGVAAEERNLTILFASVALVGSVLGLVVGVFLSCRYRSARRRQFIIYDGAKTPGDRGRNALAQDDSG